jgi:hypothetical protein
VFNCLTDAAFPKKCVEKIQTKGYDAIVRKSCHGPNCYKVSLI